MSATAQNHTDLQALSKLAGDLRKDDNLRRRAIQIRDEICRLQLEWYEAVTQQLHRLNSSKSPSTIRRKIEELEEQLDLVLAEYRDFRRI